MKKFIFIFLLATSILNAAQHKFTFDRKIELPAVLAEDWLYRFTCSSKIHDIHVEKGGSSNVIIYYQEDVYLNY